MRTVHRPQMIGARSIRSWWRSRVRSFKEPHFARASNQLRPDAVDAAFERHISAVFHAGFRHFCFEGQSTRDRFLTKYRRVFEAQPCGNPCPEIGDEQN